MATHCRQYGAAESIVRARARSHASEGAASRSAPAAPLPAATAERTAGCTHGIAALKTPPSLLDKLALRYGAPMPLQLESAGTANVIRRYVAGEIVVGTQTYSRSLIVTAQSVLPDWPVSRIEDLTDRHLEPVLALAPQVLLVGTGPRQVFPSRAILAALYEAKVGVEFMDTGAACRTYNVLAAEGRSVAAALIL